MSEGFCTNKVIPKELVGNFAHLCLIMVFSFKASIKTFIRAVIFFIDPIKKNPTTQKDGLICCFKNRTVKQHKATQGCRALSMCT